LEINYCEKKMTCHFFRDLQNPTSWCFSRKIIFYRKLLKLFFVNCWRLIIAKIYFIVNFWRLIFVNCWKINFCKNIFYWKLLELYFVNCREKKMTCHFFRARQNPTCWVFSRKIIFDWILFCCSSRLRWDCLREDCLRERITENRRFAVPKAELV